MRAVVLRGGRLEVRETPDPVPGPGELLVRTVSTAVCASDIHYMDHPDPDDTSGLFVWDADRDVVMGHEFVGEVVGHGARMLGPVPDRHLGSRAFRPSCATAGMQVIGQHPDAPGSFGELFLVTELLARAVPADADADAVALTDAFAVGEGYVAMSGIAPGQIPLVIGAGAIGLSAVAALAARGVDPIIIADFNDERLELAERFGAHITVNPSTAVAVRRLERGRGRARRHGAADDLRVRRRGRSLAADRRRVPDGVEDLRRRRLVHRRRAERHPGDEEAADDPVRRCTRRRRLVPHARRDRRRDASTPGRASA